MIHEAVEFSKISEKTGVPLETLHLLNPSYRRNYIPETGEPKSLVLPSDKIITFLKYENQIYSHKNDTANYIDALVSAGDTSGLHKIIYIVRKGDYLHKIAMQYGCTLENLRAWNKINSNDVEVGQLLAIWVKNVENSETANSENIKRGKQQHSFYYIVKKGDTMWGIASRFKCDSLDAIKTVNNIKNDHDLKPGQKLKIIVNTE